MPVLCLCFAFLIIMGELVRTMARDEIAIRDERDIQRILAPLAEPRESLLPPFIDTYSLAWEEAFWDTPTGQFWTIVLGQLDPFEPCTHCTIPEEGEPPHAGCPGCACPCTLVELEPHTSV